MRHFLRIALAVGLAAGSAPAAQAGWLMFESPEHGFAALFPTTPSRKEQVEDDISFASFRAGNHGAACFVAVADYRRAFDAETETTTIRNGFLKGMKATETGAKKKAISRGDQQLEGLEFSADSDDRSYRSLIVIDGQRAYQVAGGVSRIDGDTAELDACVGGFRLLPKR